MAGMSEKRQTDFAIDIIASMVVYELSEELGKSVKDTFNEFYVSDTCKTLYDEKTKLWWNGPSYIADMYKEELKNKREMLCNVARM